MWHIFYLREKTERCHFLGVIIFFIMINISAKIFLCNSVIQQHKAMRHLIMSEAKHKWMNEWRANTFILCVWQKVHRILYFLRVKIWFIILYFFFNFLKENILCWYLSEFLCQQGIFLLRIGEEQILRSINNLNIGIDRQTVQTEIKLLGAVWSGSILWYFWTCTKLFQFEGSTGNF